MSLVFRPVMVGVPEMSGGAILPVCALCMCESCDAHEGGVAEILSGTCITWRRSRARANLQAGAEAVVLGYRWMGDVRLRRK